MIEHLRNQWPEYYLLNHSNLFIYWDTYLPTISVWSGSTDARTPVRWMNRDESSPKKFGVNQDRTMAMAMKSSWFDNGVKHWQWPCLSQLVRHRVKHYRRPYSPVGLTMGSNTSNDHVYASCRSEDTSRIGVFANIEGGVTQEDRHS